MRPMNTYSLNEFAITWSFEDSEAVVSDALEVRIDQMLCCCTFCQLSNIFISSISMYAPLHTCEVDTQFSQTTWNYKNIHGANVNFAVIYSVST